MCIRDSFYDKHYLELCRPDPEQEEEEGYCSRPLTFEEVQDNGLERYEHEEVFRLCSKKIREDNYAEDDFLTYLTFSLFQEEYYDKAVLTYLANYYCGPVSYTHLRYCFHRFSLPFHHLRQRRH